MNPKLHELGMLLVGADRIEPPPPGLYENVAFETYHRWDAASNSRLMRLRQSPAHLRAYLAEPAEETTALLTGRAVHVAMLEPDEFPRYGRIPEGDGRTAAVKTARQMIEGSGKVALKADEYDACVGIGKSIRDHRRANQLFQHEGMNELSIIWIDVTTGITCKARLDRVVPSYKAIIDLKTTRDASKRAFSLSIYKYGYHTQAAHYIDAAASVSIDVEWYVMIAAEKSKPYATQPYRLLPGSVDAGRDERNSLLALYAWCKRTGEWPGFSDKVEEISIPDWAFNQIVDDNRHREKTRDAE